jgi:putative NADH-flavin reductase
MRQKEKKMKLAILGATGFVGKVLVRRALQQGYQVRALVREPERLGAPRYRIECVCGNAVQFDKLQAAVVGTQAVISTLPPVVHPDEPRQRAWVVEALVSILERNGIKRLIHLGGAVHGGGTHETWTLGRRILQIYLSIVCRPILLAKQAEWEVLRNSELDWTLVRPPRITEGNPLGHLTADEKHLAGVEVNVEDLVEFVLAQIGSKEWIAKAPLVASV